MRRIHPSGIYEALTPLADATVSKTDYLLRITDQQGQQKTTHDPYAFPSLLDELDLHLLGEGTHWQSYNRLGAQLRTVFGVEGVNFGRLGTQRTWRQSDR